MPIAILTLAVLALTLSGVRFAQAQPAGGAVAQPDYLTFAQGAVPVSIGGAGATLGAGYQAAGRIVDGASETVDTEFVYELPALTTFDRFAVPETRETPSPSATFVRLVEIHGSARGPGEGYVLPASATLATHPARGMVTEIPIAAKTPVRWVKLRLVGGINVMRPESSFEFSEIVGNGTQDVPVMSNRFGRAWRTMGLTLAFDSAEFRPDSNAVLAELYRGLHADKSAAIVIEGHTSREGSNAYNDDLSERRARAVVARPVSFGLAPGRVSAAGLGESRPIAPNTEEAGRSVNRRVEVHCR